MEKKIKFSIVTPTFNSGEYLEECIKSIINQNYDNYEHIIVDGGSTDNTLDIIRKYEGKYPMKWISEKDNGMYDAINKGFNMASGDVYSWLNSDDMYMPWTLSLLEKVFSFPNVKWCKGRDSYFTKEGHQYFQSKKRGFYAVPTSWIRKGYCDGRVAGFLQQESSFWTKELWENVGGVNSKYKYAGDYHLWVEFAKRETLYTVNSVLAGFRRHNGQLSGNVEKYYAELPPINIFRKLLWKTKICYIILFTFNPGIKTVISPKDW